MRRFDQINVIPFIDIMLVLLAIVLTTASFVAQGVIPVDLPRATQGAAEPQAQPVEISVDRRGHWYLSGDRVSAEQLAVRLAGLASETPVLLRVDGAASFQAFVGVIDLLKARDLVNLAIVTEHQP